MRRSILSARLIVIVGLAQTLLFAQSLAAEDLSLFQRYFGTIDYSVTGTGKLRGSGKKDQVTGEYLTSKPITIDFPRSANLVGAFLYYQSHETSTKPSSAKGYISYPSDSKARVPFLAKPVGRTDLFLPCWNTGGTGGSTKDKALLRMYRADVLRYLRDPATGDFPTQITVWLRDEGTGGGVTLVEGGSLVLVYQHPALPFKSIVIYDGTGTMDAVNPLMLNIKGFDQASPGPKKITHGVGNGQANFSEQLFFNNVLVDTNPFQSGWDNKTYDVSDSKYWGTFPPANTTTPINLATTKVAPYQKADCLSWGFVVFSTTVQDSDEDALLDYWENFGVGDPSDPSFINLPALHTNPLRKDLLVEIDYMYDAKPGFVHEHLPKSKALEMVGKALDNAPVANPTAANPDPALKGIHVIFDINAPGGTTPYAGNPYVQGTLNGGGDRINERAAAVFCGYRDTTEGTPVALSSCPFPGQPGTLSWKTGIQHIKNNLFNDARLGIFHYVLFAHQLGLRGPEDLPPYSGVSNSGRADLPGDTVAVTLGRWRSSGADIYVGSAELQAAVLMHELSHNLWGFHGGITLDFASEPPKLTDEIVPRPNCNNKQSSLNYLYLSAGLIDAEGKFNVNLSGEILEAAPGAQDEAGLNEASGLAPGPDTPYRLRWYAPIANVQSSFNFKQRPDGTTPALVAASRYCDGSNKTPIASSGLVRVDGLGAAGDPLARIPVDWNRNGTISALTSFLDINFNGKQDTTQDLRGFNDWKSIIDLHGLQQVGMGRNLFALSLGVGSEDLLRLGESTLSENDLSENDLSENDLSENDLSENDLSENDLSENDLSENDLSENDLSENDLSEIDETLAAAIGGNGPTALDSTLLSGPRRVQLTWSAPAFGGQVQRYMVYRSIDGAAYQEIGTSPTPGTLQSPFVDSNNIQPNKTYTYVVFAEFVPSTQFPDTLSGPSNAVSETP
jgi:hypothetical protein